MSEGLYIEDTCPHCGCLDDDALAGVDWETVQWDALNDYHTRCNQCDKKIIVRNDVLDVEQALADPQVLAEEEPA